MAAEPYAGRSAHRPQSGYAPRPRFAGFEPVEDTDIDPDDDRKLGLLKRTYEKLTRLFKKHGTRMVKHAAVLAAVAGLVQIVLKALDNKEIAEGLIKTTGKLRAVTELAALAFGLYKLVDALVNVVTPHDESWRTPSLRDRLLDLERKNQELLQAAQHAHRVARDREQLRSADLSERELKNYRDAYRKNERPVQHAGLKPDNTDSEILSDIEAQNFDFDFPDDEVRGSASVSLLSKAESLGQRVLKITKKYGARVWKRMALLSGLCAVMVAISRALRDPKIQSKVMATTGDLEQVLRVTALGFALFKVADYVISSFEEADETAHETLRRLASAHADLQDAVVTTQTHVLKLARDKHVNLSEERLKELTNMRSKATQFRSKTQPREPVLQEASTPALAAIAASVPYSVTSSALLGLHRESVPSNSVQQDQKFLDRCLAMDADQRRAYAVRLAKTPGSAQQFLETVAAILRKVRRDPVGNKLFRLGGFTVKWAAIFAVQAIMFSMLKYVTKINAFDVVGNITRLGLAALCAVNSVLVLLHVSRPDLDGDDSLIKNVTRLAVESKKTITTKLLPAA